MPSECRFERRAILCRSTANQEIFDYGGHDCHGEKGQKQDSEKREAGACAKVTELVVGHSDSSDSSNGNFQCQRRFKAALVSISEKPAEYRNGKSEHRQ